MNHHIFAGWTLDFLPSPAVPWWSFQVQSLDQHLTTTAERLKVPGLGDQRGKDGKIHYVKIAIENGHKNSEFSH